MVLTQPVLAAEGYGLQAVRKGLATNSALAAEGRLPLQTTLFPQLNPKHTAPMVPQQGPNFSWEVSTKKAGEG
jgi:hypothetical protein